MNTILCGKCVRIDSFAYFGGHSKWAGFPRSNEGSAYCFTLHSAEAMDVPAHLAGIAVRRTLGADIERCVYMMIRNERHVRLLLIQNWQNVVRSFSMHARK